MSRSRRSVSLAADAQITSTEQVAVSTHVVGVASNLLLLVQPGEDIAQELGRLVAATRARHIGVESKLGNPSLSQVELIGKVGSLLDEGLEIVGRFTVPVHRQGIDIAIRAGVEEVAHPVEALVSTNAVGNSGRDELGLAAERGDVLAVVVGGIGGRHGGLGFHVRLVEAEDIAVAAVEEGLDGGEPTSEHLATPEHGDELNVGGKVTHGVHVPVVGPGYGAAVGKGLDGGSVVVGSTALGGGLALGDGGVGVTVAVRGGNGGSGHESGSKVLEGDHLGCSLGVFGCSFGRKGLVRNRFS